MIKQIIENNAEVKPNSQKLETLEEHFAGCFTAEGAFDLERFKELMKDEVNISNEGYSLAFLEQDDAKLKLAIGIDVCCLHGIQSRMWSLSNH